MQSNKVFQSVRSRAPRRSMFDLSYSKLFNCNEGELIPVMHDEVVPGDIFNVGNAIVVRMQPLVAPILHEINVFVHYFFIPYRILWKDDSPVSGDWEEFITGGDDGTNSDTLPTWSPTTATTELYDLWDYFGFPTGVNASSSAIDPIAFPLYAYNMIWNEYYRDQSIQSEVALTATNVLFRNWEKDYFTSSLPWQQRGTAPALPLSGTGSVDFNGAVDTSAASAPDFGMSTTLQTGTETVYTDGVGGNPKTNWENWIADNSFDFADATTFDVADLRLAFQTQKWLERNARAGARYPEFIQSHFGVRVPDYRVQRPEYLGGTRQNVVVSEVLQTSQTDTTAQGTLAGHGLTASGGHCFNYRAQEYGLIMGLMSIMPRPTYAQGVNRQWLKEDRYDFYSPEFANLSEQAIYRAELYYEADADSKTIFGYQGRWDELRTKKDIYCADMRDTFDYWHQGRIFSSAPSLNEAFIKCDPDTRIFASETEPGFIIHHQNIIKAFRPIPYQSNPGLIDH